MSKNFPINSRYHHIGATKLTTTGGRKIIHLQRRFLPAAADSPVLVEHRVTQGERLDNITARYLGDPEQFWRLCDTNEAMRPAELTAEIGRRLRVLMPQT